MTAGATPSLLLAVALVLTGTAVAQQYHAYVGTLQPSSGTSVRIVPGQPAAQRHDQIGRHFKGAVMTAHFALRALAPSEFMKVPASLASTS